MNLSGVEARGAGPHPGPTGRQEQRSRRGATIWFTGLPGSGKSTIADLVGARLAAEGIPSYRLDGDRLRQSLNSDLGFDKADRTENVRRVAHLACTLASAGVVAVVSLISPYAEGRQDARHLHEQAGLDFLEVFVATSLQDCQRRDPKGLYARSRAGTLKGLTGVDDPYEPPESPDLVLYEAPMAAEEAAGLALGLMAGRGILRAELQPPAPLLAGPAEQADSATTQILGQTMPFAQALGIEVLASSPAGVRARLRWAKELCTGGGMLHGGAIMTLADTTGASCAYHNLPEDALGTATVESKTNFLHAVRDGWVESCSRPLHVGRSLIVIESDVLDQDGRLVARVTQTQAVLR